MVYRAIKAGDTSIYKEFDNFYEENKGFYSETLAHCQKYTAFMYEEWNRNVGAVKFYRTDADGYGIFILYKLSGAEIWIRTKNNKIYDWTLYSND